VSQRQQLRSARWAKGLTQKELAERIGATQATVARLESESTEPTIRVALAMARELETTVEALFGDK
jgi:putative transcriptional regulator